MHKQYLAGLLPNAYILASKGPINITVQKPGQVSLHIIIIIGPICYIFL